MRKFFTLLTMLLLASSAWATEVVFDATVDLGTGSSTAGAFFIEKEGVKIDVAQGVANGTHYRFYKNQLVTVTSTIGDIIKIEFTCVANDEAQYGPAGFGSVNPGEYSYSGKIGTWTGSSSNVILTPSVGQVRATKVVVTVGQAGLVPPVIKPTAGTYYDPIQVEITCSTPGAKIYYTTNGSNPSTSSTQYTAPFTLSNNTTVKAISYFNGETSEVVTADYVFSTATVVNNIAAYSAMADETVVKFNNSVTVLAQHNKYLYVKDNSGYGLFFGTTGQTYQTGDVIPAGFTGKKTTYSGEPELADLSNFQPASGHVNVTPETINPNQLGHNMWAHYVYLENVQIDPETKILTDANGNTAPVYFSMGVTAGQVTAGTTYKVWAIVGAYKPADGDVVYQLLPIKVEGEPPIPQDAVALCELGDIADNTVVTIKNDAIVLGQKGYYLYLKDTECGYGLAYGDCGQTYEPGDVIPAGYGGTKTTYKGEPELAAIENGQPLPGFQPASGKIKPTPEEITPAQVNHEHWAHYVVLRNVMINAEGTIISQNGVTCEMYNMTFNIPMPENLNVTHDVYGIVGVFNNYQILPISFDYPPGEQPIPEPEDVANINELYALNPSAQGHFTTPLTTIFQSGPNLYVKDVDGNYSLAYGSVAYNDFVNGDYINDAVATWTTYQNNNQMVPVADTFVKAGHGAPVEPEIMPIEEVSQDMIHWYLGFENVDIIQEGDDFFIKDETGQIKLYDKFNIGITTAEDTYVEGFLTVYKGELELYPILIGSPDNPFDVNKDGEVNISDINMVIDSILRGGTIGDCNGDGEVNISDISGIIDYMITH